MKRDNNIYRREIVRKLEKATRHSQEQIAALKIILQKPLYAYRKSDLSLIVKVYLAISTAV